MRLVIFKIILYANACAPRLCLQYFQLIWLKEINQWKESFWLNIPGLIGLHIPYSYCRFIGFIILIVIGINIKNGILDSLVSTPQLCSHMIQHPSY